MLGQFGPTSNEAYKIWFSNFCGPLLNPFWLRKSSISSIPKIQVFLFLKNFLQNYFCSVLKSSYTNIIIRTLLKKIDFSSPILKTHIFILSPFLIHARVFWLQNWKLTLNLSWPFLKNLHVHAPFSYILRFFKKIQ